METKNILTSWTFWVNLVLAILAFLQMPEFQALDLIPQAWMPAIIAISNIALRLKTSKGVTLKPKQ